MKCCDAPIVSYRELKESPIIRTCIAHKNPDISLDVFINMIKKYWYSKGVHDEMERTRKYFNKLTMRRMME